MVGTAASPRLTQLSFFFGGKFQREKENTFRVCELERKREREKGIWKRTKKTKKKKNSYRLLLLNSSISRRRAAKSELRRHSSQQARAWQSLTRVP